MKLHSVAGVLFCRALNFLQLRATIHSHPLTMKCFNLRCNVISVYKMSDIHGKSFILVGSFSSWFIFLCQDTGTAVLDTFVAA